MPRFSVERIKDKEKEEEYAVQGISFPFDKIKKKINGKEILGPAIAIFKKIAIFSKQWCRNCQNYQNRWLFWPWLVAMATEEILALVAVLLNKVNHSVDD